VYVTRITSCDFLAQTEIASAIEQPSTAMATMMAKASVSAIGSIPPKSEQIAMTGQVQATRPNTGSSRAASLPSTISGSERSVINM
jgi:hypothetical protein